jgi:septal ring factor EnvC (AmiA/AmiB activator)
MARIVLNRSVTLNFTADEMKELGIEQTSLTFPAGAVDIHDDLVEHWMVKGVTEGEALKSAAAAPAAGEDLAAELATAKADLATSQELVAATRKDVAATVAHVGELTEKLTAETAAHEQTKQANDSLTSQLSAAQAQISDLTQAASTAASAKAALEEQVAGLTQQLAAAQTKPAGEPTDEPPIAEQQPEAPAQA